MRHLSKLAALLGLLSLTCQPSLVLSQTCTASRQELDSQARELRESIRVLENQKNHLGYSGTDAQKRNQLSDLISRKRSELSAVESLRSSTTGKPNSANVQRQEKQVLEAAARSTREEIRLLENEKNRLGYSGQDQRRRNELSDLISRKRTVLSAEESKRMDSGRDEKTGRRLERQTLDAEVRELTEEIWVLENEKSRLGYSGAESRRRNEISNLINRKRDLLSAKERLRSQCR